MSDLKKLMPSTELGNHIDTETGDVRPAIYREGHPRKYRFNASTGVINLNGEQNLTKPGKEFSFIPVALRVFKDDLFERGRQTWVEMFFLNTANQLCSLMAHGYSVENLERLESELFYDDLMINEVTLTMKPVEKISKSAEGAKYFIAEFSYEEAPQDLVKAQKTAIEGLAIYRRDTWNTGAVNLIQLNYSPPVALEELPEGEQAPQLEEAQQ